eukprot:TRINITY_DN931_c0_g1_i1.p2 TRINITY_DN931_c0_g1~~TRINITY_DN931_c0_g1_i1.p2  ORF type:complete len:112 (+),score=21.28 TRINITY_DN931_c0_g1_i1:22-357(+)
MVPLEQMDAMQQQQTAYRQDGHPMTGMQFSLPVLPQGNIQMVSPNSQPMGNMAHQPDALPRALQEQMQQSGLVVYNSAPTIYPVNGDAVMGKKIGAPKKKKRKKKKRRQEP